MPTPSSTPHHWLVWDGDCTFCGNATSWFRKLDKQQQFTIIPAQICPSPPMTPELEQEAMRSMIVVTDDGREIIGGRAVMFVLEQCGWFTPVTRLLGRRPFVWAVNAGYRIVANNRQFFSRVFFPGQPGCQVQYKLKDQSMTRGT